MEDFDFGMVVEWLSTKAEVVRTTTIYAKFGLMLNEARVAFTKKKEKTPEKKSEVQSEANER